MSIRSPRTQPLKSAVKYRARHALYMEGRRYMTADAFIRALNEGTREIPLGQQNAIRQAIIEGAGLPMRKYWIAYAHGASDVTLKNIVLGQ